MKHLAKNLLVFACVGTSLFISKKVFANPIDNPNDEISKNTIIYPRVLKPFEYKSSISILFTKLPFDWVETAIDIPLFQYTARLGLPAGFTLNGNIQTIWVSNQISLGPGWNHTLGRFSFGVAADINYMYGKMTISGFNNEAQGWGLTPKVSLGFRTNDIAFSMIGERKKIASLKITSGNAEISKTNNYNSGWDVGFFMEQRLWKNHVMTLGLINCFQKFFFAAWPAFSTFNRSYYIPQIYVGLVL